jgi:hypothetical protein
MNLSMHLQHDLQMLIMPELHQEIHMLIALESDINIVTSGGGIRSPYSDGSSDGDLATHPMAGSFCWLQVKISIR